MLSPDWLCSKHTKTDCQQKRFGFYKILLSLHSKTKPSLSLTQNRHASTIVTVWSIRAVQFRCTLNSCHGESLQLKSNKDAVKTLAANQQRKNSAFVMTTGIHSVEQAATRSFGIRQR